MIPPCVVTLYVYTLPYVPADKSQHTNIIVLNHMILAVIWNILSRELYAACTNNGYQALFIDFSNGPGYEATSKSVTNQLTTVCWVTCHTTKDISNQLTGIWTGTVEWKMKRNGDCMWTCVANWCCLPFMSLGRWSHGNVCLSKSMAVLPAFFLAWYPVRKWSFPSSGSKD